MTKRGIFKLKITEKIMRWETNIFFYSIFWWLLLMFQVTLKLSLCRQFSTIIIQLNIYKKVKRWFAWWRFKCNIMSSNQEKFWKKNENHVLNVCTSWIPCNLTLSLCNLNVMPKNFSGLVLQGTLQTKQEVQQLEERNNFFSFSMCYLQA